MLIVTSAQFVSAELIAEFGEIPPAFLPVGNKRLYQHQFRHSTESERRILTLPDNYHLPKYDEQWLLKHRIEVIYLSSKMSLRESLIQCIRKLGDFSENISILHGDTLIEGIDYQLKDIVSIARTDDYYKWAGISKTESKTLFTEAFDAREPGMVVSGYFQFSSIDILLASLESSDSFISALNHYSNTLTLSAIHYPAWLDFGHVHTYFRSKSRITTQRSFNDLDISPRVVKKSSAKSWKMKAEYLWFKSLPEQLSIYTPHVFSFEQKEKSASYEIEYLYMSALNELAVFSELPGVAWQRIMQSCSEFITDARKYTGPESLTDSINEFHQAKVFERLKTLRESSTIDPDSDWILNGEKLPSLNSIAEKCNASTRAVTPDDIYISHGDLCFSNILYDFRVQSVRLIDPRGTLDEQTFTPYGDGRYDIAKLYHSVIGRYDFIMAGNYHLDIIGKSSINFRIPHHPVLNNIGEQLMENRAFGYDKEEIIPIMINLFISMLPLHADSDTRQIALIANALRLFKEYKDLLK